MFPHLKGGGGGGGTLATNDLLRKIEQGNGGAPLELTYR